MKVIAIDDTLNLGLSMTGSAAFLAGAVAVDGGVIVKNTEAYIGVGAPVYSNGSVVVQAFSQEIIVSLELSQATRGLAGLAGSAGAGSSRSPRARTSATCRSVIAILLPPIPA